MFAKFATFTRIDKTDPLGQYQEVRIIPAQVASLEDGPEGTITKDGFDYTSTLITLKDKRTFTVRGAQDTTVLTLRLAS